MATYNDWISFHNLNLKSFKEIKQAAEDMLKVSIPLVPIIADGTGCTIFRTIQKQKLQKAFI
jgi:hypothetical protein